MKLNKKQKRTATIASMAALLAVVLGMGGQTFAKYVTTTAAATQTATVAKWGYVIKANATEEFASQKAFKESYGTNKAIVSANVGSAVVAPGATGSMSIYVKGQAEVSAKVEFSFTLSSDVHYGSDYYPIVWTVSGNYAAADGTTTAIPSDESTTKISGDKVDTLLNKYESTFNAGAPVLTTITLTWEWPFVGDDTKDTALGNMAAAGAAETGSSISIAYSFDAEVTQVQAVY